MVSAAETTTTTEDQDSSRKNDASLHPVAQSGSAQIGGPFSRPFNTTPGEPPAESTARFLSHPTLSHPANGSVRNVAFKRAQQTHGNQFLQRTMLQLKASSNRTIQRECACGGSCESCRATTAISSASTIANLSTSGRALQLQPATTPASAPANDVDSVTTPAAGKPLDEKPRELMESRFGQDFGDVRVHADDGAAESAERLNANAFTTGRDIYFGKGKYEPQSLTGQRLLAHELTHTLQQSAGRVPDAPGHDSRAGSQRVSEPGDSLEGEADRAADAVMSGRTPAVTPVNPSSGLTQRKLAIQREPNDPSRGPIDFKTNKGVLVMAQFFQAEFTDKWASRAEGSKEKIKAGRAMMIYTRHFLPKFKKLADEATKPSLLMEEVMAGKERSIAAGQTEGESKQYLDVMGHRTWFPEHFSAEYFEEARKLRKEQHDRFAFREFYKLQNLDDETKYIDWANSQYYEGFLADMLDEQGLLILSGKFDSLVFRNHRYGFLAEAHRQAEAKGKAEWDKYHVVPFAVGVKAELRDARYAEIMQKLGEFVALKKGLLTGQTPREQEGYINGRIEDLITQLSVDYGVQMSRSQLLAAVEAGKELRTYGGSVQRSPATAPHHGQRMTFKAVLDYLPPDKTVRISWRWKSGGPEYMFLTSLALISPSESVTLDFGFWELFETTSVPRTGLEVLAHIYVGDEDKPAATISSGWIDLSGSEPGEVRILDAPEKTVEGAPVKFIYGPWIPPYTDHSLDWFVDGKQVAEDAPNYSHKFEDTGEHTVLIKVSKVTRMLGIRSKTPLLDTPPVKITVLDPTTFGESILGQMDTPLVEGMSPGSLKQLAASTEESIKQLELKVAMAGDNRAHWRSRLENQRTRLKKIKELVPDLEEAERLPKDKLDLEKDQLYSGPISSVLIHPEKGMTLPLAIYLTVKGNDTEWSASLVDATSSKVLKFSSVGTSPSAAYVAAFAAWQGSNEYPTGGQVVYRFDPVVFKGEGGAEKRSFSTSTPWKVAKEWWDGAVTAGGVIVGGLLLVAPEATITKVLGIALLAAATARSVVSIKERMDVGYQALDKENILDGIAIAASVTGIGGAVIKSAGLRATRPIITQLGNAMIITGAGADVGTFLYATSEAVTALRAVEADPTLDESQKQAELLRVIATLFMTGALLVMTNKDLIGGKVAVKSKLEPGAKIELDAATRLDMELELKATGEHESFLKSVEGLDQAARDRALVERLIDVKARADLKPTAENVRRVDDPKFSADYDAEIVVGEHTYRRSKTNGRWCRFSGDPVCDIKLSEINPEVDALLAAKPIITPAGDPKPSIEAITTDPGPQIAPAKPDGPARALPPGMPEHKEARWLEYQDGGGTLPYDRWSDLYDTSIKAKRAEGLKELADLQVTKDAAEARANDLKKQAREHQERATELDRQAAIAKGQKQVELRQQWREAKDAADKAKADADVAFTEVVDTQLQIQQKNAQLNLDARSRLPCFAAGTSVWTPAGPRSIDELKVQDIVLAYDLASGATEARKVLEIFENQTMAFYHIAVNGSIIRSTSLHQFWVESEKEWIETRNLRVGMELRLLTGKPAPITRIDRHEAPFAPTYNLHIEKSFTYFVGAGVLVHNQGPTYNFGNMRIYVGVNPDFPGYVYVGQTDDIPGRQDEHRKEAARNLKNPNLTKEQREFWKFKEGMVLEERVSGLNGNQADYLEQKNIDIEKSALGEDKVMNRREQVSRERRPGLEKLIMDDPAVKAAKLCP